MADSWNQGPTIDSPSHGNLDKNERMWGMFCHLAALVGYVGIPFGNLIGPLAVWLIKKEEYEFVNDQGKESLNFQITVTIALIAAGLSFLIFIGIVLLPVVLLGGLILTIIGAIKANEGVLYRYPFSIRLLK